MIIQVSVIYLHISLRTIAVTPNDLKGKIITRDGVIIFEKVPIVTPNNDILVNAIPLSIFVRCKLLIVR